MPLDGFCVHVKDKSSSNQKRDGNVSPGLRKIDVVRWAEAQKIKRKNKTILLVLASFWRDGFCRPSHAQIAERSECSVDTVERAVIALHRMGVKRTYRYGKTGKRISNEYALPVEMSLSECRLSDGKPQSISYKKRHSTNPQNAGETNPQNAGSILPLSEGKRPANGKKHYWVEEKVEGERGSERWSFPPFGCDLDDTFDGLPFRGAVQ